MPYHVGAKGSNGCSGYPAVKEGGEVMGCHETEAEALAQVQALYANEAEKSDTGITPSQTSSDEAIYPNLGIKKPTQGKAGDSTTGSNVKSKYGKKPKNVNRGVGGNPNDSTGAIATTSATSMGTKAEEPDNLVKEQGPCWDGYAQRGMKPGDNGKMVPNCVPVSKMDDLWEDGDDVVYDVESMNKVDGYVPPAGARAAARRAIKFKEDGKATGAGTSVGWTRAGQLARGERLSLSTVKRMYSYFSRHEVDKKGKDWANQSNPSNGYIMWLAWGGDAGFSWARGIVERERKKYDDAQLWAGSAFAKRKSR